MGENHMPEAIFVIPMGPLPHCFLKSFSKVGEFHASQELLKTILQYIEEKIPFLCVEYIIAQESCLVNNFFS